MSHCLFRGRERERVDQARGKPLAYARSYKVLNFGEGPLAYARSHEALNSDQRPLAHARGYKKS